MIKFPLNLADKDSLARKLVEATLGGACVRIAGMGLTFLVGIQLARQLGPEGYGVYGTVMALVALLLVPSQLGLTNLATRDISVAMSKGTHGDAKGALIWFSVSTFAASLLTCAIGILILELRLGAASPTYYWGLVSIPLLSLTNLGVALLRGFHRLLTAQIYDALLRPFLFALLLFAATVSTGLDVTKAMLMQAVAAALTLAVTALKVLSLVSPQIREAKAVAHWRNWCPTALSMAGTEIVRVFDGHYAVLLFGVLANINEVGIFRVALSSAGFVGLPATLINLAVAPFVAQLHACADRDRLQTIATGSARVIFGCTTVATLAFAASGDIALALVFGESYRNAWAPLTLLSLGYVANGFFGSTATILNMTGHEKTVASSFALGVGLGVVVNLCFFPFIGINSAGVALIISESAKGAIMRRAALQKLGVDTSMIAAFTFLPRFVRARTATNCVEKVSLK